MHRFACAVILLLLATADAARAQDFSVYTRIFDARSNPPATIGRSMTLFHAGKVYDFLDSGSRTTIFEPAQKRFVIIDEGRRISATISLEDLENCLYQEEKRLEDELTKRRAEKNLWEVQLADFQLHPVFQNQSDPGKLRVELTSRVMTYTVKCDKSDPVDLGTAYLDYADWAARLNYISIPQAPFPGPRLQLNETLRRQQLLPVEVSWKLNRRDGTNLVAKHQFGWKLESHDRDQIHQCEKLLHDPALKAVPLTELLFPKASGPKGGKGRVESRSVTKRKP